MFKNRLKLIYIIIILDFENGFDIKNQKLKAVQILESTSAGFENDTMDVLKKEFQEFKNIKFNKIKSKRCYIYWFRF